MIQTKSNFSKRVLALFLSLVVVFTLTGCCGYQTESTINADGSCSISYSYIYEDSFYKTISDLGSDASSSDTSVIKSGDFTESTKKIGKFTYHVFTRSFSFASCEELKSFLCDKTFFINTLKKNSKAPDVYASIDNTLMETATVSPSFFIGTICSDSTSGSNTSTTSDSSAEIKNVNSYLENEVGMRMDFSITFPNTPTQSNGTINGNTVNWSLGNMSDSYTLIADCGTNTIASDSQAPTITNIKNNGIYKPGVVAKASDNLCLQSLCTNKGYHGANSELAITGKDGKYTITATDVNNNSSSVTITLDSKSPTIKGAKNKKTYTKKVTLTFNDKNGIKSIKVNGKKIKVCKKKTFKKKGSYSIQATDKAGNKSSLKFKIK